MPEKDPHPLRPRRSTHRPLIQNITNSVRATMLAGIASLGCINLLPTKAPEKSPLTYEQQKQFELDQYQPSEAEINYFLEIFSPDNFHEFINKEEKVWIEEESKYELAQGFARLVKTMKIEKVSFKDVLKKIIGRTKFILHSESNPKDLSGASGNDIEIYPKALAHATDIIFHELVHSFHTAYGTRIRNEYPFLNSYYLYEEGATEVATKIGLPNTCETAYAPSMLFTAALGKDFYRLQFEDIYKFNETIAYDDLGTDNNKMILKEMEKYIQEFALRWKISDPNDLNELKDIFGIPEFKNPPEPPPSKRMDYEKREEQEKKEYERIAQLKKLLKKYGIDWKYFLESISPPSNNFAKDWSIFIANSNNRQKYERWRELRNCPK